MEGSGRYHRIIECLYNDTLWRNNYLSSIEKINLVAITREKNSHERRLEAWTTGKVVEMPMWQKEGTEAQQDLANHQSWSELKPCMSLSLCSCLRAGRELGLQKSSCFGVVRTGCLGFHVLLLRGHGTWGWHFLASILKHKLED